MWLLLAIFFFFFKIISIKFCLLHGYMLYLHLIQLLIYLGLNQSTCYLFSNFSICSSFSLSFIDLVLINQLILLFILQVCKSIFSLIILIKRLQHSYTVYYGASLVAQLVKNLPAMW